MKFGSNENHHMVDILFTLALFCVFTASALLVVIIGANVYRSTVTRMQENYSVRTALSYVTEKIRQYDTEDSVDTAELSDGTDALLLKESYDGKSFCTYIYEDEGKLMELYIDAAQEPEKSDGRKIMDVDSFTVEKINPTLFYFTVIGDDGASEESYVSVHSSETGGDGR